ncbi:hypothetical protein [Listeria booriae]|uniref:hypothetical protein n=1 Tax=Listeria booriae TaxID=1552123 RepID=UPI001E382DF5|nr:hypothetical protein [Listeria booriae]MCD2208608.1 hypothetical protein [Listeria booriae]
MTPNKEGGAVIKKNNYNAPKKKKAFVVRCVQKTKGKARSIYATIDFETAIYPDQAARALDNWHKKKGAYQIVLQNDKDGNIAAKHLDDFFRFEVQTRPVSVDRLFRIILSEEERLELSNFVNSRW